MRRLRVRPHPQQGQNTAQAATIDTTPFADIAFHLLIFFLVTATFTATRGLDMALPESLEQVQPIEPQEAVFVEVLANGELQVDGRALRLDALLAYLAPKLQQDPSKPVLIRPEPEAPYGRAVDVLDELRQGRSRLGLSREIEIALPTARELAILGR